MFNDPQFAWGSGDWLVPIRSTSCAATGADQSYHPSLYLLSAFLALHLAYDAVHAYLQGIHGAAIDTVHLDAAELQRFMHMSEVGNIAGDTVWSFCDQHLELAAFCRLDQIGKTWAAKHGRS
jgi:hypothetical protein